MPQNAVVSVQIVVLQRYRGDNMERFEDPAHGSGVICTINSDPPRTKNHWCAVAPHYGRRISPILTEKREISGDRAHQEKRRIGSQTDNKSTKKSQIPDFVFEFVRSNPGTKINKSQSEIHYPNRFHFFVIFCKSLSFLTQIDQIVMKIIAWGSYFQINKSGGGVLESFHIKPPPRQNPDRKHLVRFGKY